MLASAASKSQLEIKISTKSKLALPRSGVSRRFDYLKLPDVDILTALYQFLISGWGSRASAKKQQNST